MEQLVSIIFVYILIDNFVLQRFFGVCPLINNAQRIESAMGMSMAMVLVMTLATPLSWLAYNLLLEPLGAGFLQIVVFVLIIILLGQIIERLLRKNNPNLMQGLGNIWPLVTPNCAVLAAVLLTVESNFSFIESIVFGFAAALGFSLVLLIVSGIRDRLEVCRVPAPFQGAAITLIALGILSFAFHGFSGMFTL